MTVEVELKYHADGPEPLARLASTPGLGLAWFGEAQTVEETDRYLDTDDGRLAAARWAARLRRREGRTRLSLKGPAEAGSGAALHRRPEVEGPATDTVDPQAWPASEASVLLDRIRAGRPLVERFRLVQSRTERAVLVDGEQVGTLTLDVVAVAAGGAALGTLHVVELELVEAAGERLEAVLAEIDASLRGIDGLRPDERTKLEHALDLLGAR